MLAEGGKSRGKSEKEIQAQRWWPSGMTQHLCQRLLNVPHASLTVTHCRMPGSDRCGTKGAVVYHYVSSLLPSLHPSIACLPQWETGSLLRQSGRCCVADMSVTAEKWEVGFVEIEGYGGSEPNKLCRKAVLPVSLTPLAPGGVSTCSPGMPLCLSWMIIPHHAD